MNLIELLFLLASLLALLVTIFAVWHIFIGVPAVPSSHTMTREMVELARLKTGETVFDLGAGDARLLVAAKQTEPTIHAIGYELLPSMWFLGWFRIKIHQVQLDWYRKDFFKANLESADVILLYTLPSVLEKLETKFDEELKEGTRILSHAFQFPMKQPVAIYEVQDGRKIRKIFEYQW